MDLYFDEVHADQFLSLLIGGMSRAQDRFHDSLNTVDEHGNVIDPETLKPERQIEATADGVSA